MCHAASQSAFTSSFLLHPLLGLIFLSRTKICGLKVYELVIFLAMRAMNKKQSDTRKEERCSDSVLLNT